MCLEVEAEVVVEEVDITETNRITGKITGKITDRITDKIIDRNIDRNTDRIIDMIIDRAGILKAEVEKIITEEMIRMKEMNTAGLNHLSKEKVDKKNPIVKEEIGKRALMREEEIEKIEREDRIMKIETNNRRKGIMTDLENREESRMIRASGKEEVTEEVAEEAAEEAAEEVVIIILEIRNQIRIEEEVTGSIEISDPNFRVNSNSDFRWTKLHFSL